MVQSYKVMVHCTKVVVQTIEVKVHAIEAVVQSYKVKVQSSEAAGYCVEVKVHCLKAMVQSIEVMGHTIESVGHRAKVKALRMHKYIFKNSLGSLLHPVNNIGQIKLKASMIRRDCEKRCWIIQRFKHI